MATSTIPAVRAALLAAIQARPALATVQSTIGIPRTALTREWIMVGGVEGAQRSAAIGQQKRDERFVVRIVVSVVASSLEGAQATSERAFVIVGEIEQAIRPLTQPPLGVANLIWALVEKTDLADNFDGNEREAAVTMHIACKARI